MNQHHRAPDEWGVVAGVVVFHPEEQLLLKLVGSIAADVQEVVIYANSPVEPDLERRLRDRAGSAELTVIRPDGNRGLGIAYDTLLAKAAARGAPYGFLLDQDSLPRPGTIPTLVARHRDLAQAGERAAIVGPSPLDPAGRPMRLARRDPGGRTFPGLVQVSFVISSGSLVAVEAARSVGSFRDDFFIDAIDLEWCFRATARGYSIWVANEATMDHRLGRGVIRLPFGLLLADQPPLRLYTFMRNQLFMLRLSHVPLRHKAKTLLALPLRLAVYLKWNRFSRETRIALRRGLIDGMRGRLGPPDRVQEALRSAGSATGRTP